MAPARALHDILAELAQAGGSVAAPAEALATAGHGDLPDGLVAEAIVSYADTAPAEVAAHLAPFVTDHSALARAVAGPDAAGPELGDGWALLATAPAEPVLAGSDEFAGEGPLSGRDPVDADHGTGDLGTGDLGTADFGTGEQAGSDPFDLAFEPDAAGFGAEAGEFGAGDMSVPDPVELVGSDGHPLAGLEPLAPDPLMLSPTQPGPIEPVPAEPEPGDPDPSLPGPDEPDPADPGSGDLTAG